MNRRFFWSLLFALILPLAQAAAAAHEVSHVRTSATDKSAPAALHCDMCAVAAAVTGGAAPSEALVILHAPAAKQQPAAAMPSPRVAERVAFFLSRAPPSPH
jgi:hypothetical protein